MSIATEASAAPVRPIPIILTMTFDKDLYEGQGGFHIKFHSTPCMGISGSPTFQVGSLRSSLPAIM